jgi:hypothetical protein
MNRHAYRKTTGAMVKRAEQQLEIVRLQKQLSDIEDTLALLERLQLIRTAMTTAKDEARAVSRLDAAYFANHANPYAPPVHHPAPDCEAAPDPASCDRPT